MNASEQIKAIKKDRYDLSDYLIHFTRQNEKSSFDTLLNIVNSGIINCGWSIRNEKRTIFGKIPAICFTDMPLFSFYQYVANRKDYSKVDFYGIAIHKSKMFQLGARNVIYGTTIGNETENGLTNDEMTNPNLSENEQYRYMLTNINDTNDWTHEREWRWTNQFNISKGNYLPIWKNDPKLEFDHDFTHDRAIFIIVREEDEIETLKEKFSEFKKDEHKYNRDNIGRTYAISLESIEKNNMMSYDGLDFTLLLKSGICTKM